MGVTARARHNPCLEMMDLLDERDPAVGSQDTAVHTLPVDAFVDHDTWVLQAEIPGIDPGRDLAVTIHGGILSISGERRPDGHASGGGHGPAGRHERHVGRFGRRLSLPGHVVPEQATAVYAAGVLEVRMPLAPAEDEVIVVPVRQASPVTPPFEMIAPGSTRRSDRHGDPRV